ncbi:unnamed protein product [Scytosiphon promiscuus]
MANLFSDSRENDKASTSRLRQCLSMVLALKRADKLVANGGNTVEEAARVLLEDVHDAIFDLLGLQLQAGHDMNSMKESMRSMEDDVSAVKDGGSAAEAASEAVAEARKIRRQRKLDQVEIPEEHLLITNDVLGRGGFGEVYLADYNGYNAAAKVLHIAHDLGAFDENQKQRKTSQRRAFLRELEAMIRLRSPNTVNVFGAVTSLSDRMVLVMELMPNGDLRTLLKNSEQALPEEQFRQIIGDIGAGMTFLHSKETVHGDLKSANVLLDGAGRAKVTVLDAPGSTYASDVYSFGIVAWEVLSRELPWANVARPREVYIYVVLKSLRPDMPVDAPTDIVNMIKACWAGEPDERPTFSTIMQRFESGGWSG